MGYVTRIYLFKEDMKFSGAHFTLFSAHHRERLHGHNFKVRSSLLVHVTENGMPCDYNLFKKRLREVCAQLDEYMLLPAHSPYLNISEHKETGPSGKEQVYYKVLHHEDVMYFLKSDTLLLPLENITVEELSQYLLQEVKKNNPLIEDGIVSEMEIQVASGDGQYAGGTLSFS